MSDMGRRVVMLLMLALLPAFSSSAQYRDGAAYRELDDSETVASLKSQVRYLSSAMLEGRKAGSEGEKLAAAYVTQTLRSYGVDVLSPADGEVFGLKTENGDTLTSRNVLGFVQGYDKNLRDRYIVVGARLDNLGSMTMTVDELLDCSTAVTNAPARTAMMLRAAKKRMIFFSSSRTLSTDG